MNSNIAKFIFKIGSSKRNPSLIKEYDKLKESEWYTKDELEALQLKNARSFFSFVEQYSPYYKDVFKRCGFLSKKMDSLNAIKNIPIMTKIKLIEFKQSIHTDYVFNGLFLAETSGTSGNALEFNRNEQWDSINRASVMRAYDWYDVKPWNKHGYLWGYNISPNKAIKVKVLDQLQNRFRIFDYSRESIEKFTYQLFSAQYVAGYSSMIYEVAKIINQMDIDGPPLKLVKGTSEMILDAYQEESKKAFGRSITSEYGAAESGLIAFECPKGNMHINVENVIIEVDSENEIIVTNLASYSYPVIRYKLGDVVTLSDEKCSCGRGHPILKDIMGRKGSSVLGISKTYPALTFYYVFKNLALNEAVLLNYKVVQKERGFTTIFIEGKVNNKYENIIMNELIKYFSDDIDFKITYVNAFDREKKKSQYFESLL